MSCSTFSTSKALVFAGFAATCLLGQSNAFSGAPALYSFHEDNNHSVPSCTYDFSVKKQSFPCDLKHMITWLSALLLKHTRTHIHTRPMFLVGAPAMRSIGGLKTSLSPLTRRSGGLTLNSLNSRRRQSSTKACSLRMQQQPGLIGEVTMPLFRSVVINSQTYTNSSRHG
jgi:hypothetical protein